MKIGIIGLHRADLPLAARSALEHARPQQTIEWRKALNGSQRRRKPRRSDGSEHAGDARCFARVGYGLRAMTAPVAPGASNRQPGLRDRMGSAVRDMRSTGRRCARWASA
jgi:hypothetical protein